MPKRRKVNSLKDICHRRIALSFDKHWMTHYDVHFKKLPRLLYVIGPFESLSSETIQHIIDHLIVEKCLKRGHFMCLMQESLSTLDLSKAGTAANHDSVLQTIMARCPNLVSANLQSLNNISVHVLADLVKTLPGLRVLNLKQTNCNDQVMSVIGHRCRDLLNLDVSVTKITNMGAFSLCQAFPTDSNIGCVNLLQLRIFGTMINMKGAVHIVRNLPKLQYFGFDDICTAIEIDEEEREAIPAFQSVDAYKLRNLYAHGIRVHEVSKGSIELACRLCPDTVEARLYCSITDQNIPALKTLQNLSSLDIGNSEGQDLTFENGLLPVLVEIGHQLVKLVIADVNDFDLWLIGHWCRNLRKLSILISGQIEHTLPIHNSLECHDRNTLFEKLEEISFVYPLEEIPFQKNAFLLMLKNAKSLKTISIHYMQTLTSEMLLEVLLVNPLNELEDFELVSCDKIGPEAFVMMLAGESCNSLTRLDLKNCRSITMQDYQIFKDTIIKSPGYDVKILWT